MTERTLPIFLLCAAAIVVGCVLIGVWWLSIPIVLVLLPGPFVTPAILRKLALRRAGTQFRESARRPRAGFRDDDAGTLK